MKLVESLPGFWAGRAYQRPGEPVPVQGQIRRLETGVRGAPDRPAISRRRAGDVVENVKVVAGVGRGHGCPSAPVPVQSLDMVGSVLTDGPAVAPGRTADAEQQVTGRAGDRRPR